MAKGNDGNYLQHCIEVEAAARLAQADPDGRLHIALTHGMAPFEPLENTSGSVQKALLYEALKDAGGKPQPNEPLIVRAYRDSEASKEHYPNTAELLRVVVGAEKLSGGITEIDSTKCTRLAEEWSRSNVEIKKSSWRSQLGKNDVLSCPLDLDKPWLFSMDPMSYKEEVEDEEYLLYSDLEKLKLVLREYFNSGQPGIACFFVYNMRNHGNTKLNQFWAFVDKLANNLKACSSSYWIIHDNRNMKLNLAVLLCTDLKLLPWGISSGRPSSAKIFNLSNTLRLSPARLQNTKLGKNQRRIERMNNWIEHAGLVENGAREHIKFLFYWIAYEAAYKIEEWGNLTEEYKLRSSFHKKISACKYAKRDFQRALWDVQNEANYLLRLRQASRHFWYKKEGWDENPRMWERKFEKAVKEDCDYLKQATYDGNSLVSTLNALFSNLSIVRNQIVHGGSSGKDSHGRNQVIWGTKVLQSIIPKFRNCIRENKTVDWEEPPFPRVGDGPDDPCLPRWIKKDT